MGKNYLKFIIWLKKNWFKLGILIVLIVLICGIVVYLNNKNNLAKQERLDRINRELEEMKNKQYGKQLLEQKEEQKQSVNQVVVKENTRITSQIIEFEDILEGKIVDADINCKVLAAFNNLAVFDSDFAKTWPGDKENYKKKCLDFYLPLVLIRNKLVAEPELQDLRRILTAYIDSVRTLAMYALDGGYSTQVIDKHSAEFDIFRLEAREELLRLQRKYNVKPQYINQ